LTQEQITGTRVPPEVIGEDQDLVYEAQSSERTLSMAKDRRKGAFTALNRFRWEMVACPFGPQYSAEEYAAAVGVTVATIRKAIESWQITLNKGEATGGCAYEQDHAAGVIAALTDQQIDDHDQAKHVAERGEIEAAAAELLAKFFNVSTSTVTHNHREKLTEAMKRLDDQFPSGSLNLDEARRELAVIAMVLKDEDDLRIRRERAIQHWLAENRGLDIKDIKQADVRRIVARIERRMEKYQVSWEGAEEEVREFDRKSSEADKIKNEEYRKFQLAVLNLQEASADARRAARDVVKAAQQVEQEGHEISPDVLEITIDDLNETVAAVTFAKAALTGNSGVDWDQAMMRFFAEDGA
jgi:hypothetical protein